MSPSGQHLQVAGSPTCVRLPNVGTRVEGACQMLVETVVGRGAPVINSVFLSHFLLAIK